MSKICHHNEKPSATGLFTKGQNLVADGQTSKMPSTTSGAGQIETNFGKQYPSGGFELDTSPKRLMGMCCWMGLHFHDWIDYNGVAFF